MVMGAVVGGWKARRLRDLLGSFCGAGRGECGPGGEKWERDPLEGQETRVRRVCWRKSGWLGLCGVYVLRLLQTGTSAVACGASYWFTSSHVYQALINVSRICEQAALYYYR